MGFAGFIRDLQASRRADCENLVVLPGPRSTDSLAHRIAVECLEETGRLTPSLIVAVGGPGGAGRRTGAPQDPAPAGLRLTLLQPLSEPPETLPLLAAVGVCRGLDRHFPGECRLGWPGDVLVAGRTVGALHVETLSAGEGAAALIGFGAGVERGLPAASPAADVPSGAGKLVWDLVEALHRELLHAGDAGYALAAYQSLSRHRPGDTLRCRLRGEVVEGTFLGFDARGALRLRLDGRERRLACGEILQE